MNLFFKSISILQQTILSKYIINKMDFTNIKQIKELGSGVFGTIRFIYYIIFGN